MLTPHHCHTSRRPGRRLWPVLLLACLPLSGLAETEEEKTRAQLQSLERDIQRISREISSATSQRDKTQRQLRDAEETLGRLQREIAATGQEIDRSRARIAELEQERARLEGAREAQQARIAAEMRAAWQMGSQGRLKVLLSQEDPHTLARAMTYHRYLHEARRETVADYRRTLAELAALGERADSELRELERHKEALAQQRRQLGETRTEREKALAALNADIDSKAARLEQLQDDRRELEKLLQAIEEAVAKLEAPADHRAFAAARGEMPWPLEGQPSNRFGSWRNAGKMRWQGVTIPAEEGTTVQAIHHGRVVYADWLRGSGLLLIIDHGDGYMSLYAHNQSLLREVGEWVAAGAAISTVGSTGGRDRAALYFEVRHQGVPVDPALWCRG
ncbi:MAG: peptidoglycan DD-metalloendopeptidase family protein [Halioglobus sp.]|nr:peptidoglycan DD-metalloendopeptidase family protein [Halioglobus sp.]